MCKGCHKQLQHSAYLRRVAWRMARVQAALDGALIPYGMEFNDSAMHMALRTAFFAFVCASPEAPTLYPDPYPYPRPAVLYRRRQWVVLMHRTPPSTRQSIWRTAQTNVTDEFRGHKVGGSRQALPRRPCIIWE